MKITEDIRLRLERAVDYFGSQTNLEKKAGLKPSSISNWLKKGYKAIDHENWMKIEPFLYSEDHPSKSASKPSPSTFPPSPRPPEGNVSAVNVSTLTEVPVISVAQAVSYEPALCPMVDYCKEISEETMPFPNVKPGYFALRIEGDSMSPDLPNGSIVLVGGGEWPERGDVVVAKFADDHVVCKRYHRRNNVITLTSINPKGQDFEWHCKEEPNKIQWMFPVRNAFIDFRMQRWEKEKLANMDDTDEPQTKQEGDPI